MLYQPNTLQENKPETTVKIMVPNLVHALKWDAKIHMVQTYTFKMEDVAIEEIITDRIRIITIDNRDAHKEIDHRNKDAHKEIDHRTNNSSRDAHKEIDHRTSSRDAHKEIDHRTNNRDVHKETVHRTNNNRDVKL